MAYSAIKPEVGYCQSMNFMVAFFLMMSGGNEKETFWFFYALLEKSIDPNDPNYNKGMGGGIHFDGLSGFYIEEFPLLLQYMGVFRDLFAKYLPDLHQHF